MKKRNNRFLAGTLAGLMMLTMLPVTALAAQEGADGDAASDTSNNIVNVVSDDENGQQDVNINIAANGGNASAAARQLSVSRRILNYKIARLGIAPKSFKPLKK